jgi:septum formation protein
MSHNPRSGAIVLASGSPRRVDLLGRLGVAFQADPGKVEERPPRSDEVPSAYALDLARQKSSAGHRRHPDAVVLGADTVVTIDGRILGKPRDEDHALAMLQQLRGRCHSVITAVSIHCGSIERSGTVRSKVCMYPMSDDDLRRYIGTREPMDKAGSYAVQGLGGRLVECTEGCYNNIVGLPLCLSAQLLAECGMSVELAPGIDVHAPS